MDLDALARQLAGCDRLLLVAAAGLSISADLPNNPYHNPSDFARHYPAIRALGYRTAYEAMGVSRDPNVSEAALVGYVARHFLNMRFKFPPTPAYAWLKRLAESFQARDPDAVFCWTSNVDGCFARAGFDPDRVWTTQGEMSKYQCMRCGNVWDCEAQLRAIDAACDDAGVLQDMSLVYSCPKCAAPRRLLRPNLRGGDWFDHSPYQPVQDRLLAWLDDAIANTRSVAVLEVGVGPNTPVVTRIPAAAFASALAAARGHAVYVRVNPDPPEHASQNPQGDPRHLAFTRLRAKWDVLEPLVDAVCRQREQQQQQQQREQPPQQREQPPPLPQGATNARGGKHSTSPAVNKAASPADPQEVARWRQRYLDIALSLRTPRE